MIAVAETETLPTTLTDIAAALDEHLAAIREITAERDEFVAGLRAEIAEHEADAEEKIAQRRADAEALFARRAELEREAFPGLAVVAKPGGRKRGATNGGTPKADYSARIAKRERTLALKRFSIEKGYALPAKGEEFSPEVQREFDQAGGYQG